MKIHSCRSGFSMVEVLIVLAMFGVIFMGVLALQSNIAKNQHSALNLMEVTDLKYEIAGLLSNQDKCSALLGGEPSNNAELTISASIKSGAIYGKLKITSVQLNDIRDLGKDKRAANIRVMGTKIGGNPATAGFTESMPVYYTVNASNLIVTCKDNSSVCTAMGGSWKVDHCDFCASLGGTLQPNNTCAMTP